ncbi:MAG: tetratricopeptide repeat protein [Pyrinomonadaceae bacterium]
MVTSSTDKLIRTAELENETLQSEAAPQAEICELARLYLLLGQMLEKNGELEEAISNYRKSLDREPTLCGAWLLLGNSLRQSGDYEEAETALEKALKLSAMSDAEGRSSVLFGLALNFYDQEEYETAFKYITDAIALDQNPSLYSLMGECLYLLDRDDDALAAFDQAIELDPNSIQAWIGKADALASLDRLEEALGAIDYALILVPDDELALTNKARILSEVDKFEQAISVYDQILQIDPNNVQILVEKGAVLCALKRPQEALEITDQALSVSPQQSQLLIRKGQLLSVLGRAEEGLRLFDQAIEQSSATWAINQKANTLFALGRHDEAFALYDTAEERQIDPGWGLAHKAHLLRYLERFEEALDLYSRALKFKPESDWILAGKAETLYRMRDYEHTIQFWNKVIELTPDSPEPWGRRGEAYRYLGKLKKALADLDQGLKIAPKIDWFLYQRFAVKSGAKDVTGAQEDLLAAIKYGSRTYVRMPDNWMHACNLALYHLTNGEFENAERLYREATAAGAPVYTIREAMKDLDDNASLLGNTGSQLRGLLETYVRVANVPTTTSEPAIAS